MEKDKAYILDDRGYIFIEGKDSEEFLQNILTNDVNKIKTNHLIFSSILSPQGKYLYEFFVIKYLNKYLIECEKDTAKEVFDFLNFKGLIHSFLWTFFNFKFNSAALPSSSQKISIY